jgi:spore maturation protein CgeB
VRFVIFTHSLASDWNHGNAHFLRGIATELIARGYDLHILEPADGWSRQNLIADAGEQAIAGFHEAYPQLQSSLYDEQTLDIGAQLRNADVVLVHEWNSHDLIRRVGEHHARNPGYRLFFHDTHHRSATEPGAMAAYDLQHYDGVLAYGNVIRDLYRRNRWATNAWTWHEAADTKVFRPLATGQKDGDLVWIGNWGDGERTEELREFLIEPVKALKLRAKVYGVRYPAAAIDQLRSAGIEYGGWLPNYMVPRVFARYNVTVHVPRHPYTRVLPGIPTIRPFEALACAIPLISAPWNDCESLFRDGQDLLFAEDGPRMTKAIRAVLSDSTMARSLAESGLETIRERHTCAHRVDQLLTVIESCREPALCGGAS